MNKNTIYLVSGDMNTNFNLVVIDSENTRFERRKKESILQLATDFTIEIEKNIMKIIKDKVTFNLNYTVEEGSFFIKYINGKRFRVTKRYLFEEDPASYFNDCVRLPAEYYLVEFPISLI